MTSTVLDFLASSLADLDRVESAPEPPLGFGGDLSCVDDLDADMREVSGDDIASLAQALMRRILTPRGSVPDAPDYGIDLRGYLHRPSTRAELLALSGDVQNEWSKDDRVARSEVQISAIEMGKRISGSGRIYPADPNLEAFTLTFGVTDAGAAIEEIYGR